MYKCCNIKRFLKLIICDAIIIVLAACLTGKWAASEETENDNGIFLPIIMYHSICDNHPKAGDYIVSTNTVENDLKYLSENGYNSVFIEDLINYVYKDISLPPNPVVITLDDGFYNNITNLLPLLEKYDMKATISIIGTCTELAEKDSHNPTYSYMTWDDIKSLNKTGYVEFGNHTFDMHSLSNRKGCTKNTWENDEQYSEILMSDIGLCQNLMYLNTGITPTIFTYPYGFISRESIPIIRKLGFLATLTCCEKPNYITKDKDSLFGLNRYNRPQNMSTESYMNKILNNKE